MYALGIHVGTTVAAAAVSRLRDGEPAPAEAVRLGAWTASALPVGRPAEAGRPVIGARGERRERTRPDRVVTASPRRVGQRAPTFVGSDAPARPAEIAAVVRRIVDRVAAREGGPAQLVAITHPAGWGPRDEAALTGELELAGVPDVRFVVEPVAAAAHVASDDRLAVGSTVAVYGLGGRTFSAAVVRRIAPDRLEVLGTPTGMVPLDAFDPFGDAPVAPAGPPQAAEPAEPDGVAAPRRVPRQRVGASSALPTGTIHGTVRRLAEAIESTGVDAGDIESILLVGGSAGKPLVARLLAERFGRPLEIEADPTATIALGAARLAGADLWNPVEAVRQGDRDRSDIRRGLLAVEATATTEIADPVLSLFLSPPEPSADDRNPAPAPGTTTGPEPASPPRPAAARQTPAAREPLPPARRFGAPRRRIPRVTAAGALAAASVVLLGGSAIATAMYDRTTSVPAVPATRTGPSGPPTPTTAGTGPAVGVPGTGRGSPDPGRSAPVTPTPGPATSPVASAVPPVPPAIPAPSDAVATPPAPPPEPAAPPTPTPDAPGAVGGPAVVVTLNPTSASGGNALGSWSTPTAD